jgi:biopolymer transport protein ExbD
VELLAQGARFFELLGYVLAVSAVGILGAGVIWSVRSHVPGKHRELFLFASLGALTTLCGGMLLLLVLSQPLSPNMISVPRSSPKDRGRGGEDATHGVYTVELRVRPDGTVLYQGREFAAESIAPHLRREYGEKQLDVTLRVDAEATLRVVQPIVGHLQQHGVERYSIQVGD